MQAATATPIARAFGAVWIFSSFLYLPYTVTDIVYDQLPVVAPDVRPYRSSLELASPVAFVLAVLLVRVWALLTLFLLAALAQLGLLAALAGVQIHSTGWALGSFQPHGQAGPLAKAAGNLALLFVCGSLVVFFGGEARGGGRAVDRALVLAFAIVAPLFVLAAFPLARADTGHGFALAVAWASIASTAGLILAEFLALGRILVAVLGTRLRSNYAALGIGFIALDAVSRLDPERFYGDALNPSLIALFVAQLAVFLCYPLFSRRTGSPGPIELAATAVASALAVWGVVSVVQNGVAS